MGRKADLSKPFVVVIIQPSGHPMFMVEEEFEGDDVGVACRFATEEEARAATKGAMWEHAWDWYVIKLA